MSDDSSDDEMLLAAARRSTAVKKRQQAAMATAAEKAAARQRQQIAQTLQHSQEQEEKRRRFTAALQALREQEAADASQKMLLERKTAAIVARHAADKFGTQQQQQQQDMLDVLAPDPDNVMTDRAYRKALQDALDTMRWSNNPHGGGPATPSAALVPRLIHRPCTEDKWLSSVEEAQNALLPILRDMMNDPLFKGNENGATMLALVLSLVPPDVDATIVLDWLENRAVAFLLTFRMMAPLPLVQWLTQVAAFVPTTTKTTTTTTTTASMLVCSRQWRLAKAATACLVQYAHALDTVGDDSDDDDDDMQCRDTKLLVLAKCVGNMLQSSWQLMYATTTTGDEKESFNNDERDANEGGLDNMLLVLTAILQCCSLSLNKMPTARLLVQCMTFLVDSDLMSRLGWLFAVHNVVGRLVSRSGFSSTNDDDAVRAQPLVAAFVSHLAAHAVLGKQQPDSTDATQSKATCYSRALLVHRLPLRTNAERHLMITLSRAFLEWTLTEHHADNDDIPTLSACLDDDDGPLVKMQERSSSAGWSALVGCYAGLVAMETANDGAIIKQPALCQSLAELCMALLSTGLEQLQHDAAGMDANDAMDVLDLLLLLEQQLESVLRLVKRCTAGQNHCRAVDFIMCYKCRQLPTWRTPWERQAGVHQADRKQASIAAFFGVKEPLGAVDEEGDKNDEEE